MNPEALNPETLNCPEPYTALNELPCRGQALGLGVLGLGFRV